MVALVAAYAIALSGLFGGWVAAGAAAAVATFGSVICHDRAAGTPAPTGGETDKACIDSCCVGCLLLTAALPPPPAKAIGALQYCGQILAPAPVADCAVAGWTKSHQSRAPPLSA